VLRLRVELDSSQRAEDFGRPDRVEKVGDIKQRGGETGERNPAKGKIGTKENPRQPVER